MIATGTELMRRESVEEIEAHRKRALKCYAQAADLIAEGNKAAGRAAPQRCGFGVSDHALRYIGGSNAEFIARARRELDRHIWRHLIQATGLGDLMDATARKEFEDSLDREPPEATADNLTATCLALAGDAPRIFERSIVKIFERLCPRFKSNDSYHFGPRIIIEYGCDQSGFLNHYAEDKIRDLERALHVLDGKPTGDRLTGIANMIRDAKRGTGWGPNAGEVETPYLKAKWFKGGTIHLHILRPDLLKKLNHVLAKHYGEALAQAS